MGLLTYDKPMRKYRFPKTAYVRQLERLYAALTVDRDTVVSAARYSNDRERGARLLYRSEELAIVQELVQQAAYVLDNIRRLS